MDGIKFKFPSVTAKIIGVIFENSNPTAELSAYRKVWDPPHTAPRVWPLQGLQPTAHTAKFYESTDGTTLQTLLDTWAVDPTMHQGAVSEKFEYEVDRGNSETDVSLPFWSDPVSGSNSITDNRLQGATYATLDVIRGRNTLLSTDDYLITVTGIELTDGAQFEVGGEKVTIRYYKTVVTQTPTVPVISSNKDIQIISAGGNFDATFYGLDNIGEFSGSVITTTFPTFSSIPNRTWARFSTYGLNGINWRLKFASGNSVKFRGGLQNEILLGKDEMVELFFKSGSGRVLDYSGDYSRVGVRFFVDRLDIEAGGINFLLLNGDLYQIDDYPRLYEEHISKLPPAQVVSMAKWAEAVVLFPSTPYQKTIFPYKHFFAVDEAAGTFKVPDDSFMQYRGLKTFDGIDGNDTSRYRNVPGGYQHDMIDVSSLQLEIHDGAGGSGTSPLRFGNGNNPTGFAGCDVFREWMDNNNQWLRFKNGGTETVGKNVGQYPVVGI